MKVNLLPYGKEGDYTLRRTMKLPNRKVLGRIYYRICSLSICQVIFQECSKKWDLLWIGCCQGVGWLIHYFNESDLEGRKNNLGLSL